MGNQRALVHSCAIAIGRYKIISFPHITMYNSMCAN